LARALGDSPQIIEQQKNARDAQSKLAYYAAQTGRQEEAAAGYEKLLAVFPCWRYFRKTRTIFAAPA
jgi:hypothetical protein